jgi:hypothetical protein
MSEKPGCETCAFRARYDDNPSSLLGRIWRWHAGWCPGWRSYITSLPDGQRRELAQRYQMIKYAD